MGLLFIRVGAIFSLFLFLSGCADVIMSGAQVVYNRRSLQKNFSDQYITMEAFKGIKIDNKQFKDAHVTVATFNGEVLLAGQVLNAWQRNQAERIVKTIPNVKEIHNLLTISNPSSSLTRISDSWLTAKIKAQFIASNDLDSSQIKVVTENGTVYLMGIITPSEAKAAVDIARKTDGVERVVKIFSYVLIKKHLNEKS